MWIFDELPFRKHFHFLSHFSFLDNACFFDYLRLQAVWFRAKNVSYKNNHDKLSALIYHFENFFIERDTKKEIITNSLEANKQSQKKKSYS